MAKSADAFRTISEVSEWLDTPAHVLRFWESKFSQVKPVKRAGGRRYYRPSDMELLGGIKRLLHEDGMTIKGVQKMLREKGVAHVSEMSQPLDAVTAAVRDAMDGRAVEAAKAKQAEAREPAPAIAPADADGSPDVVDTVAPAEAIDAGDAAPEVAEAPEAVDEAADAPAEDHPADPIAADTAEEGDAAPAPDASADVDADAAEAPEPVQAETPAPEPAPEPAPAPSKPSIKAVAIETGPTVLSLALARKTPLSDGDKAEVRALANRLQNWLARQTA